MRGDPTCCSFSFVASANSLFADLVHVGSTRRVQIQSQWSGVLCLVTAARFHRRRHSFERPGDGERCWVRIRDSVTAVGVGVDRHQRFEISGVKLCVRFLR